MAAVVVAVRHLAGSMHVRAASASVPAALRLPFPGPGGSW